jgi:hypothetical protein
MPWKCPACEMTIRHDADIPLPRQVYRCHICRLELVADPKTGKLTLAPLPPNLNAVSAGKKRPAKAASQMTTPKRKRA